MAMGPVKDRDMPTTILSLTTGGAVVLEDVVIFVVVAVVVAVVGTVAVGPGAVVVVAQPGTSARITVRQINKGRDTFQM